MGNIFCLHCQHLHMNQKGRLCRFSLRLGSVTWLCPCQQHTATQNVTYSGLSLLPAGYHGYSELMSLMPVLRLEELHSFSPHPPSLKFFPSLCPYPLRLRAGPIDSYKHKYLEGRSTICLAKQQGYLVLKAYDFLAMCF